MREYQWARLIPRANFFALDGLPDTVQDWYGMIRSLTKQPGI